VAIPFTTFHRAVNAKKVFFTDASVVLTQTVAGAIINARFLLTIFAFESGRTMAGSFVAFPTI